MRKGMLRWLPVLFLTALLLLAVSSAAGEGVTRALLVGCDTFVSMPNTAPAAEQNLIRMEEILWTRRPGMTDCRTALNSPGTAEGLERLLQETFGGAAAEDTALIYVSTHGLRYADGRTALLLSDGREEEALTAERLTDMLSRLPGKKILILDACYSGGMIGKGMAEGVNAFAGTGIQVLTSAGGLEESALWMDEGGGGSWFLAALEALLSGKAVPGGGNGDGFFSLRELREGIRTLCGDSRACCYPEDGAEPLFSVGEPEADRAISNLRILSEKDDAGRPKTELSFTVGATLQLWYRMVFWKEGGWDFDGAVQMPDRERFEGIRANLSAGEKQRTVRMTTVDGEDSGFALLQLMTIREGAGTAAGSRRIALTGDRETVAALTCGESFTPSAGEELHAFLTIDAPCSVTAQVENESGEIIRTLSREEPMLPAADGGGWLDWSWSGLREDGETAEPGFYLLHVIWEDALGTREAFSGTFELRETE